MARAGDVIEIPATGEKFVFRETAADTNGELLEMEFQVKEFVPPRHVHAKVEERIELVSGALRWHVGGKEGMLTAGERVVLPRGVGHTFWNEGPEQAHFIAQVRPALDYESLFETIFGLYRDGKAGKNGQPRLLQNILLAQVYDSFLAGPPIWLQRPVIAVGAALAHGLGYRARYEKYSGPE